MIQVPAIKAVRPRTRRRGNERFVRMNERRWTRLNLSGCSPSAAVTLARLEKRLSLLAPSPRNLLQLSPIVPIPICCGIRIRDRG